MSRGEALLAYDAANRVEDEWDEQLVKRGWVDTSIPTARVIWLVVVVLTIATTRVLLSEDRRAAYSPA